MDDGTGRGPSGRRALELLAGAVHDLRNPLSVAMGWAELLAEDPDLDAATRKEALAKLLSSCRRMSELLGELGEMTALERGLSPSDRVELDLARVARESAEAHRGVAGRKGQVIEIEVDPPGPVVALGDPSRARRVVDHYLSNALKFSRPGSGVRIQLELLPGAARCAVTDRGPGLTPEEQARLFSPFPKLAPRPTGGEPTTGLGLTIVKRLADEMAGRVWCESVPGDGATFVFELPRALET